MLVFRFLNTRWQVCEFEQIDQGMSQLKCNSEVQQVYNESQTIVLQILCNMVNDSCAAQTHLFDCGLPGLVLTVLSSDIRPADHQVYLQFETLRSWP